MHIRTYSRQTIQQWLRDQRELANKILAKKKDAMIAMEATLAIAKQKRGAFVNQRLNPIVVEITLLTAQINVLTLTKEMTVLATKLASQKMELSTPQCQLKHTSNALRPINQEISNIKLSLQLIDQKSKFQTVSRSVRAQRSEMRYFQERANALNTEHCRLSTCIRTIQARLNQLQTPPITANPNLPDSSACSSSPNSEMATLQAELDVKYAESREIHKATRSNKVQLKKIARLLSANETQSIKLQSSIRSLTQQTRMVSTTTSPLVLQNRLSELQHHKDPLTQEKCRLEAIVSAQSNRVRGTRAALALKQHLLEISTSQTNGRTSQSLPELEQALSNQNKIKREVLREKVVYDADIRKLNSKKDHYHAELTRMVHQLKDIANDSFAKKLIRNPDELYGEMVARIHDQIAVYEIEHPAKQSLCARMALADLQQQLSSIASGTSLPNHTFSGSTPQLQRYYRLSGLLWKLHQRTKGEDAIFARQLEAMLGEKAVDPTEANKEYELFQQTLGRQLQAITPNGLRAAEKSAYDTAADSLKEILEQESHYPDPEVKALYQTARKVMNTFNHEATAAAKQRNDNFDLKYHTRILNKVTNIVNNPADKGLLAECKTLCSHHTRGKPSLCKKVTGAIMAFIGAAAIAAGVCLSITSPGLAAPLTIGLIAGGGTLVTSGFGLFYHGRTKDDVKRLRAFQQAAESVPDIEVDNTDTHPLVTPDAPLFGT